MAVYSFTLRQQTCLYSSREERTVSPGRPLRGSHLGFSLFGDPDVSTVPPSSATKPAGPGVEGQTERDCDDGSRGLWRQT